MALPRHVRSQLKSLTPDRLISALLRDGWTEEESSGATRGFIKEVEGRRRRIVVHYHQGKNYHSPKLVEKLIQDAGWSEDDLIGLRLIRRQSKKKKAPKTPRPQAPPPP